MSRRRFISDGWEIAAWIIAIAVTAFLAGLWLGIEIAASSSIDLTHTAP